MTISTRLVNGKNFYYVINNDGKGICSFDSLAKAGLVMRYLQGANMPPEDCSRALNIMQIFDKDSKARAAEQEAKRAERREKAKAAQNSEHPPEMPVEAFEGVSPVSERTETDDNGQAKDDSTC